MIVSHDKSPVLRDFVNFSVQAAGFSIFKDVYGARR
jgi:hypothetical protein